MMYKLCSEHFSIPLRRNTGRSNWPYYKEDNKMALILFMGVINNKETFIKALSKYRLCCQVDNIRSFVPLYKEGDISYGIKDYDESTDANILELLKAKINTHPVLSTEYGSVYDTPPALFACNPDKIEGGNISWL